MKKIVPGISMAGAAACMLLFLAATSLSQAGSSPLGPPEIGTTTLQLLSPTVVELSRVTSKAPPPARVTEWDYVTAAQELRLPPASAFQVSVDGQPVSILDIGFRRRPLYAPLKKRDLRIGNNLYLKLSSPVPDHALVRVDIDAAVWPTNAPNTVLADPWRESQVIHLSQVGYLPGCSKKAIVGYYLGSLQELDIPSSGFQVVERDSGQVVFSGALSLRQDVGYNYVPPPYQNVWEADFTPLREQGQYRVVVPGLGASRPFRIDDGVAACMARTYALGLYHQRCGTVNELPFTRHIHGVCHTAKADVPTMAFSAVNNALADFSSDYRNNPRHTAPQLKAINASLYPFVNSGKVDVSGGHHDAGDYSKYTINSAQLIHALIFAIDALPGVAALDNLGLPESGDGLGDLMQEAKWEAEFLAKMQDADGGFYFLVYPRTRAYEDNVLPDRGDPQAVFPKNTAATAAAIAALAQTASSPTFRRAYPELAAQYLAQALQGWAFLQRAFAQFGRDGSYQKISHYGDEFMHDDEIAWAATELFGATGDHTFEAELTAAFNP
ncbi:MAG: glycoside hydrolase family 9 protein [Verrucomicrobiota bacterium]